MEMIRKLRYWPAGLLVLLLVGQTGWGYIEAAYALGRLVNESANVVLLRVEKVDKTKNLIVYRKVRDIKGILPGDTVKHDIGQRGFAPREWQNIMAWAEVGKSALFFAAGGASETCIDRYWYQTYAGDWWGMSHAEPYLLRTYCGKPEKLAGIVAAMLAGQEVVVPCMADGDKNALQLRTAKMQRTKASLKLLEYDAKRDFVGWGGEEYRPVLDMPGFSQYCGLGRIDPGVVGVAPADFDGDGKPDFCLFGEDKVSLLQNSSGLLSESALGVEGGARSAVWADFNGDGRPDLLLATPAGPRLFLNLGKSFREVTNCLPRQGYYSLTAAGAADFDGDGQVDILLADAFCGLRLYRNRTADAGVKANPNLPLSFADISDKAGLGADGLGGGVKGQHLLVADVNGDGLPDFLFGAGTGLLAINTPPGFVEAKDSGINYQPAGVTPVFGDFMGDKRPGLFVPQPGKCRLFKNDGKGHFTDVTEKSGAFAQSIGHATCAAWADFSGRGRLDLIVGCFRGPNRFFRNNGEGRFIDRTEELGLDVRIFNTRALCVTDLTNRGVADVIFANEGQESAVLLGNPARPPRRDKKAAP